MSWRWRAWCSARRPAIAAVNKIDRVRPRERLLPYLAELAARHEFLAIVPVSALKAENIAGPA